MFGLIRLPILLCIAFVAGMFYERNNQSEACADLGDWRDGLCFTTDVSHD